MSALTAFWAKKAVERCARTLPGPVEVPTYGSPEFERLPNSHPARWLAVLRAAECWRLDGEELARRLHDEVAAGRRAHEVLDAEEFAAVAAAVRSHAGRPTALGRAARRWEAQRPRPGDHVGGPVPWRPAAS